MNKRNKKKKLKKKMPQILRMNKNRSQIERIQKVKRRVLKNLPVISQAK